MELYFGFARELLTEGTEVASLWCRFAVRSA